MNIVLLSTSTMDTLTQWVSKHFTPDKVYQVHNKKDLNSILQTIKSNNVPALGICYNFRYMIGEDFLNTIPTVNVHFSLLPKYRGAVPIQAALLNGEKEIGITIHKIVKALDAGNIISRRRIKVNNRNAKQLITDLDKPVPSILDELISKYITIKDKKVHFTNTSPQDGTPTYCYKSLLLKQNAYMNFNIMTAKETVNRIRAFNPEPIAWTNIKLNNQDKLMNIYNAYIDNALIYQKYNEQYIKNQKLIWIKKVGLAVKALQDYVILSDISIEGKNRLQKENILSLKGKLEIL